MTQGAELTKLIVKIHLPSNIYCLKDEIELEKVRGKEYVSFDCFISREKFPYENEAKISFRYEKGNFCN